MLAVCACHSVVLTPFQQYGSETLFTAGRAGALARKSSQNHRRRNEPYCCYANSTNGPGWRAQASCSSRIVTETLWERPALHTRKKRRRGRCRGTLHEADYAVRHRRSHKCMNYCRSLTWKSDVSQQNSNHFAASNRNAADTMFRQLPQGTRVNGSYVESQS